MKMITLSTALLSCSTLFSATQAEAFGLCVDVGSTGVCNDFFFSAKPESPNLFSLHGYEYGCGKNDREATGVLRRVDNTWFIGFTGSSLEFDFAEQSTWNGSFDSNFIGTVTGLFTYINGGVLTGHGFNGDMAVSVCGEPPAASQHPVGVDLSIQ